ncbi:MAG TPA: 16S rRNA (cytidine(1402)-2'-O)-methyltransferase [bacterium]|nr:16S rRNA (cytidine(1402)-2'-O)-methyltransferase [bacterium]
MSVSEPQPGVLYVVATPIGNLKDITLRALAVLGDVDWIAAEDTRRTRILLDHHGIKSELTSLHGDVEKRKSPKLVESLLSGRSGAIVSDAGTPGASDPGGALVRAAASAGVKVSPVPGPSSVTAALSCAGVDSPRYVFEGFVPRSGAKRTAFMNSIAKDDRHIIFFESALRLKDTLSSIRGAAGDRKVVLFRELTKMHEEIIRTTLEEVIEGKIALNYRGEFTVMVIGGESEEGKGDAEEANTYFNEEKIDKVFAGMNLSTRDMAKIISGFLNISKNKAYSIAEGINREGSVTE